MRDVGLLPRPSVHLAAKPASLSAAEIRVLSEHVDLDPAEKRRILAVYRAIEAGQVASLFKLPPNASARDLKRAYFELSKLYHPDRFYGRDLGSYGPMLDRIFATLSQFMETLRDSRTMVGETSAELRRRRHARHPYNVKLALRRASRGALEAHTSADLGSGGLFIATADPAALGEQVALRFVSPEKAPVTVRGTVTHVRRFDEAGRHGRRAGMGVEIDTSDEAARRVMKRLLALTR
jgi:uncharacterized protein (TIGR02266 family)